jgi:hypothetical protein
VIFAVFAVLFTLTATFVVTATRRGYGIEMQTVVYGLGFGVAALISFGCWLFLKAK